MEFFNNNIFDIMISSLFVHKVFMVYIVVLTFKNSMEEQYHNIALWWPVHELPFSTHASLIELSGIQSRAGLFESRLTLTQD